MTPLVEKKCVPCEGGAKPLDTDTVKRLLKEVPQWHLGADGVRIARDFKCKDFAAAMALANRVAALAEEEGHHPDILIHGWNRVRIETWTHAIRGLSENDFILAAKVDRCCG